MLASGVQEADRLRDAFKKEEFREMFKSLVADMADPEHRREQEEYLAQMEREQQVPKSINLIRPEVCDACLSIVTRWRFCIFTLQCMCCVAVLHDALHCP